MSKEEKITWINKIVITKAEGFSSIKIDVEGLWSGKDRIHINRSLRKKMRTSSQRIINACKKEKEPEVIEAKKKAVRAEVLIKARQAKKDKKEENIK